MSFICIALNNALIYMIKKQFAIDLEGPRCASILNELLNMVPKKYPLALQARGTTGQRYSKKKLFKKLKQC